MSTYTNPKLQNSLLPDVTDILAMLKLADQHEETSRDVRPLMSLLMRMQQACPRLGGNLQTRRTAVSSYTIDLVSRDPTDKRAEELMKRAAVRLGRTISTIKRNYVNRAAYGVLALRLEWNTAGTYGTTPSVVERPRPVELETHGDDARQINLLAAEGGGPLVRTPLDREDPRLWLLDRDDEFVRGGLLRSLIFHEILIHEQVQEWASFNRKLKGLIEVKWKQWASDKDKEAGITAVRNLARNNFAAMSDALQTVFTKVTDAAGNMSFEGFKKELQSDSAIRVLGQANTPELPDYGGSRAAIQVQAKLGADIHFETIEGLETLLDDQLLLYDYQLNHDLAADLCPWQAKVRLAEELDREKEARTIAELVAAGMPVPAAQAYEATGFRMPLENEPVIGPRTGEAAALVGMAG